MPVTRIVYPHCSQPLQTAMPVAAGQQVYCPRCRQDFLVGAAPHSVAPTASPVPVAPQPASIAEIDNQLGFQPVHLTAGDEGGLFGSGERMKNEWTMWLLAALFVLVLGEMVLAWFCGRAW